jgi:hypothetical protein
MTITRCGGGVWVCPWVRGGDGAHTARCIVNQALEAAQDVQISAGGVDSSDSGWTDDAWEDIHDLVVREVA